jgi:hypothetical protein
VRFRAQLRPALRPRPERIDVAADGCIGLY